ncbi:conserved hypothetical protein [Cupriavidus taiwanensis]|nr:conserved hypothetical protein [Cupriavidus taiwanensis]
MQLWAIHPRRQARGSLLYCMRSEQRSENMQGLGRGQERPRSHDCRFTSLHHPRQVLRNRFGHRLFASGRSDGTMLRPRRNGNCPIEFLTLMRETDTVIAHNGGRAWKPDLQAPQVGVFDAACLRIRACHPWRADTRQPQGWPAWCLHRSSTLVVRPAALR